MAETSEAKPSASAPGGDAGGEEEKRDERMLECNICLDTARDAVVSMCGHLFWWDNIQPITSSSRHEVEQSAAVVVYGYGAIITWLSIKATIVTKCTCVQCEGLPQQAQRCVKLPNLFCLIGCGSLPNPIIWEGTHTQQVVSSLKSGEYIAHWYFLYI